MSLAWEASAYIQLVRQYDVIEVGFRLGFEPTNQERYGDGKQQQP